MNNPHPQYKVCWVERRVCEDCGFIHKEQYTWSFFTPKVAMEQAVFVLRQGHSLLSVDQ